MKKIIVLLTITLFASSIVMAQGGERRRSRGIVKYVDGTTTYINIPKEDIVLWIKGKKKIPDFNVTPEEFVSTCARIWHVSPDTVEVTISRAVLGPLDSINEPVINTEVDFATGKIVRSAHMVPNGTAVYKDPVTGLILWKKDCINPLEDLLREKKIKEWKDIISGIDVYDTIIEVRRTKPKPKLARTDSVNRNTFVFKINCGCQAPAALQPFVIQQPACPTCNTGIYSANRWENGSMLGFGVGASFGFGGYDYYTPRYTPEYGGGGGSNYNYNYNYNNNTNTGIASIPNTINSTWSPSGGCTNCGTNSGGRPAPNYNPRPSGDGGRGGNCVGCTGSSGGGRPHR